MKKKNKSTKRTNHISYSLRGHDESFHVEWGERQGVALQKYKAA